MTINRQLPDGTRYASISEQVLDDDRISCFDKIVLAQLLTKTPNWKVVASHLASKMKVNEKTIRRSLKSLELAGYATPIYSTNHGFKYRADYDIRAVSTPDKSVPPDTGVRSQTPDISVPPDISVHDTGQPSPVHRTNEAQTPDKSVPDTGQKCPATESVLRHRVYGSGTTASEETDIPVANEQQVKPEPAATAVDSNDDIFANYKPTQAELEDQEASRASWAKIIPNQFVRSDRAEVEKPKASPYIKNGFVFSAAGGVLRRANQGDRAALEDRTPQGEAA